MNHASSSSSRDQAAATPTTESQVQVQLPVSTSTTTIFPITDLTTHPSSIPHPTSVNTFNTIDIPYTESSYSSSNVSPASTSTPATPITGAGNTERIATTRSPSVSAAGTSTKTASVASTTSASSDLVAPSAAPPAKAKRVRTSKPKVKTGCANCKQRRIKCDEARPACTQCVRSNKTCTGYPPPSRSSRPFEEIRIAPKPMPAYDAQASSSTSIAPLHGDYHLLPRRAHQRSILRTTSPGTTSPSPTTYHPSSAMQIQPNESFYFDIFRSHTANELSGFFDNLFWTHYVLQACHSEDAIKCAVIALGALYQTLEQTAALNMHSGSEMGGDARVELVRGHWQVAIRRYGDACNALVKLNTQDQRSHRTSIMANVLLACFDSFIGDHRQAIHQIQTGLGLLDIFRTQQRQRLLPVSENSLEEELVIIFTRLAIQAKSYDMAFHFPQPFSIRLSSQSQTQSPGPSGTTTPSQEEPFSIPETFTSVVEARVACDALNARIMRYIEELFAMKTDLKSTLPQSWLDYGLHFKDYLDAWGKAFDNLFFTRHNPSVSLQEKAGIAALKMLSTNSRILYLMMFSDKESDFDNFLPQFQTIVDLGTEIVGDEERRAASRDCPDPEQCQHRQRENWQSQDLFPAMGFSAPHLKPRFAADIGIVAPLFVVATKCRDPGTRRRAIQLLRSSARREGMWDSEMVANISAWVMNLEESEALSMGVESYHVDGITRPIPRIVPEEKRFTIRSVDFDLRTRVADLQVGTRGLPPGIPDSKFRQTRLNW
ncbi:Aspercryptin biosynthesis cluster-specific transcription regulator atnN [Fusarium oxysporum f. sp. rapae]|uniref:Aspercryptin biosynthesis cluster-specific transcription regulator atnN n=1 Tax=Fusarium oxysporum f. sp. rapae TaxID=485398 RepID=A0A8J5P9M6_FUSOX|nr:Aspercryptin biosynthesis cluster-specific transcription regulator atnN [Fusarium oxysporum f. sp. rapae]